jgi:serine protease
MKSPAPGSVLPGPTVTFTWTAGTAATRYFLYVGSTGVGSSNLYISGATGARSATAGRLPINGELVCVRLTTYFCCVQINTDYTHSAAILAALTSPVPGAVLQAHSATFSWSAGTSATGYSMWFGSGVGKYNLKYTTENPATSVTVTGLPTNGETVYVRLCMYFNSVLTSNDYTNTAWAPPALALQPQGAVYSNSPSVLATAPATMVSPEQADVLGTSNVAFAWTTGTAATKHDLWLGLGGPESSSPYRSVWLTTSSTTVTIIPSKGAKVCAGLHSLVNGAVQYNDYTYIER